MTSEYKYDVVSVGAILRDYTTPKYADKKHEMLCDIADCLYNNGQCMVELLKPDYKRLYDEYGREWWALVLQDMDAIDSQIEGHERELIEDYNTMLFERYDIEKES